MHIQKTENFLKEAEKLQIMGEEYPVEAGDESVYESEGREVLAEDDEISPEEEAFLKGYEEAVDDDVDPLE